MQELTNKVMDLSETSGLGIVCSSLLSHGGAKSAAAFHSSLNLNGTLSCARKKTAMKKLMFAATAMLCGAVLAESGITSANVVGYQGLGYDSAKKALVGFTFMPVSGATKIKLSDVKAVGMEMDPDTDAIQLLDPETTKTQALYTYVTEELAKEWDLEEGSVGWWDKGAYGPDFESRNDVDIDVGRGFLLLNAFGHNIQFTCAGAVPTMSTSYTTSGKKALVATYMPTDMTLGDIVIPGLDIDPDTDAIQVLDPNTTKTKALYTYVSAELAEEWDLEEGSVGWWDKGAYGPDFESRNNVAVKSGDTFLLLNAKGHTFNFQYKSALDVTKPTEE